MNFPSTLECVGVKSIASPQKISLSFKLMSTERENFLSRFWIFLISFYVLVIKKSKILRKNFSRSVDMTLKLELPFWREAIVFTPTHSRVDGKLFFLDFDPFIFPDFPKYQNVEFLITDWQKIDLFFDIVINSLLLTIF